MVRVEEMKQDRIPIGAFHTAAVETNHFSSPNQKCMLYLS
jgi:hypothetical protein